MPHPPYPLPPTPALQASAHSPGKNTEVHADKATSSVWTLLGQLQVRAAQGQPHPSPSWIPEGGSRGEIQPSTLSHALSSTHTNSKVCLGPRWATPTEWPHGPSSVARGHSAHPERLPEDSALQAFSSYFIFLNYFFTNKEKSLFAQNRRYFLCSLQCSNVLWLWA